METSDIDIILDGRGAEPFDIMEVLQDAQASYGYLPEEVLRRVAVSFDVPLIEVFRLANFYTAFSLTPRGRHVLTVCTGTACHVRGTPKMLEEITTQLQIQPGETTEDRVFTLETVNCLGACALGPVVVLDGRYHDHMDAAKLRALLDGVRLADQEEERTEVSAAGLQAGDDLQAEGSQLEVAANA